ncbi:hypothetical protein IFR05_001159 [Cadophora sp. M221]|nr:hypothetical protein IFR05_001159 [Cadophora sp. M221]
MSAKPFSYDSLAESDSIRLLLLEPGQPGDPIHCSLIHTSIAECHDNIYEQYTALSYVWGSQENPQLISVGSRPFRITANLAAALDDLRDSCKPLRLWADAICIDQSNIRERNHQIKHMRDIFSLAQRTVVYLGQSTEMSSFVLERLHHWRVHGAHDEPVLTKAVIDDMAALHILSRAWFGRVWTYQELVLSKEVWVQCGRHRLKWDVFCTVLLGQDHRMILNGRKEEPEDLTGVMSPSFLLLLRMRDARLRYILSLFSDEEPEPLLSVLLARRGSGVTDPRDMVYGHFAVSGLHHAANGTIRAPVPEVDYSKSVAQVFAEATVYIINSTRSNHVLFHSEVRTPSQRRKNLPSWVPDWSLDSCHHLPPFRSVIPLPQKFPPTVPDIRRPAIFVESCLALLYKGWSAGAVKTLGFHISHQEFLNAARVRTFKSLSYLMSTWIWNLNDRSEQALERGVLYAEIYSFWQKKLGNIAFPELPSFPNQILESVQYKTFWRNAEDMYSLKFPLGNSSTIEKDTMLLDQFLMEQALRITGFGENPGIGREFATLVTGGVVIVPATTLPGDVVFFQPIEKHLMFTVLRHFSSSLHMSTEFAKVDWVISQKSFNIRKLQVHYYTLVGAACLGANNDIQKLMYNSVQNHQEHIIALF